MVDRLSIDDLDDTRSTDPRWTESKLVAAGYSYTGDGACKSCGDPVSFYKREPKHYAGKPDWQVVDQDVLSRHRCQG